MGTGELTLAGNLAMDQPPIQGGGGGGGGGAVEIRSMLQKPS